MARSRLLLRTFTLIAMVATGLLTAASPASACSLLFPYIATADEVSASAADLNDPNGPLAQAYAEYEGQPMPKIIGAYAKDTIAHVEPTDNRTRGSVVVLTHTWGQPGTPNAIVVFEPEDTDECGAIGGEETGFREVRLVSTDGSIKIEGGEAIEAELAEIFGEPVVVERDADAEASAIESIQPGPRWILIASAVVGISAAALVVTALRRR